jgi:molybdopterin biosynthesis enzyme
VPCDTKQTIARLTPLADVLALIEREVMPVTPRTIDIAAAAGRTLAADLSAPERPNAALALIDGWAVAADATAGAGGYAPAVLPQAPLRVNVGQALPAGTDSVAPLDAVRLGGTGAEALAAIVPGDGVLPAGADCGPGRPLARMGQRLRDVDVAAAAAAGIARVTVREPRLRVVAVRGDSIIGAAGRLIARDTEKRSGSARLEEAGRDLGALLASGGGEAVVAIGGTGHGRNDVSVQTLAREGRLVVHGIAISPGETAAFGFAGERPVLLLPGRLDAALAVWLTVGRRMLARLAGARQEADEVAVTCTLARKIVSNIGLAELVPMRRSGGTVEPVARQYLSFSSLTHSDGWSLVPAESEGYPAGTPISLNPWP